MKQFIQKIGTVNAQEIKHFTTSIPWEPVTLPELPYSILSKPKEFMFTFGSACGSLATTSLEGYTYIEDTYIFRKDGNGIDVDRYLGSITLDNAHAVLKVPSRQISFHPLSLTDKIIDELPPDIQNQVLSILGTQNP